MADLHKCADCGFLAVRRFEDRQLVEVELGMRETGQSPRNLNLPKVFYEILPICFKQAWPLHQEAEPGQPDKFREVVQKEGECSEFIVWRFGSTVEDRQEMVDRKMLLDWQAAREEADREWRANREDADNKARERDFKVQLAIVSVIAIIAALLGGWAQATFQPDPMININVPAIASPSASGTPSSR
ncbi:MAG: hypothetical protein EXR51_00580 [Dehalococcoidia bacterium]|nr:hypothetical protein [Dehalococcoidia bacterium]